jgi:ATP-dependent DNA helicase RecG
MTDGFNPLAEIANGEDRHHEFKRRIDNPESIAGEIVAFANSDGGVLYIGIEDDGEIAGLEDSETVFQTLANICRDRCIPPVSPILEQHRLADKEIVVLTVLRELNRQKPYRTAGGRFYIRVGRVKKDATGRELIRIAQSAGELHYDETPVIGAGMSDFSMSAFETYHRLQFDMTVEAHLSQSGISMEKLLRNLRLLHEPDREQMLSVAGVLIFGNDPQYFLPQSRISAVAFAGKNEDSDILDRHEITGRLPQMIEDVRIFLKRNIRSPAIEHGFCREDIRLYDEKSLGEALINAVAHRDYSLSGSQIRMFLFSDRFEVRSPGGLPNAVTLENIKLGMHAERNRAVVNFLTHLGYMSAVGTGIPRLIIRLSRRLSGREPEFEIVGEELRVRIYGAFPNIAA